MLCMLCMLCCGMLLSDRRRHDTKRNYGRSTQQRSYLMVSASPTTSSSVDISDTEDGTDVGMLAEEEREGQRLAELHPFDTALLISLANGFLVALDEDSGDVLWSFNTGAPLVSSNVNAQDVPVADTSHDSDTDTSDLEDTKDVIDDDNVRNGDTKRSNGKNSKAVGFPNEGIFPGTDGSLYTYQGDPDSASPRIHRLPVGIRELVDASPSPALDGTMLLGSQESVVFVLDAENGQVLRRIRGDEVGGTASAFMSDPESLLDAAEEYEKGNLSEGGDVNGAKNKKRKVFLTIGRKDYVVRAIHPAFGEQWNVSYAFLQRLSSLDVKRSNSGNLHIEVDNGYSRFDPDSSLPMYMFKLGADNSLRRYDASGKRELWVSKFDAPPLVAYPPAGNPIDLLATAVFQDENKVQVQDSRNIKRNNPRSSTSNDNLDGGKSSSNALIAKNEDTLVIGVLGGGLYGMRVSPNADSNGDTCMSEDDGQHATADLAEEAEKYSVQNPVASDRTSSTKNQNSAASTALIVQNKGPSESNFLHKLSEPNMDHSCAESFGLFSVEKDFCDSHMLFLPDNLAQKPKSIKKSDSLHWEDYITMFKDRLLLFLISRSFSDFISREAFMLYLVAIVAASIFIVILKFLAYLFRKVTQLIIGVFGYSSSKQKTQSRFMMKGNSNLSSHERHAKWTKEPDGSFRVGRLKVEPAILGYGSGGTVVFEGVLDGRKVAVKRLLRQFVDLAKKEIETLIASDEHPNVVRCFAMEEDSEFVYLALERCVCTLADVVSLRQSEGRMDSSGDIDVQKNKDNPTPESSTKEKLLDPVKLRAKISDNWHLISKDGSPTLWALQVAENVAEGLAALHARGIVHRDVKPHNVLITESGRAKLSDMGLSKRLVPEQASFETAGGAGGSPGWQAPEQLVVRGGGQRRLTASVDVFSFGLLLHYCLSGGKHPFGEGYERDAAIMHGKLNLNALSQEKQPEALDLIEMTLAAKPQDRPPIAAVLRHPMWWSIDRRLSFLIDVSDTVEGEDRVEDSILLSALEKLSHLAIGEVPGGNWANVLDPQLLENLGRLPYLFPISCAHWPCIILFVLKTLLLLKILASLFTSILFCCRKISAL